MVNKNKVLFSFITLLLWSTLVVFAVNPTVPISPNDNIQDPGDPLTPWGGCGPTDSNCYVAVAESGWGLSGNAGTTAGTNFIGTTDNIDVVIKRNNIQVARLYNNRIIFGENAGNGATGAQHSNFLGSEAGDGATSAQYSNFLGYQAGDGATGAQYSNFLGSEAGDGATSAQYSNFLGRSSGNGATGADNSNFLGSSAGLNATSAFRSNFLGGSAGQNATNARYSNFLGGSAGQNATNAMYSNFLGGSSGYGATGAEYSNFLGNNSGYQATNASYSNLFGYQAGYTFTANNIGSNNIIIGTNISLPDTTANAINLGGVLFGTGTYATTTGDPSIAPVSSGKIGIATIPATYTLEVGNSSVSGIVARFENSTGTCDINPTTTALVCSSDETLKSNIASLDSSLASLSALRPVTYTWNGSVGSPQDTQVGFIAQEVEQVFPNLVFTDPTTGLKSLAYTNLIPYTVKAIQDINLSLTTLEDTGTSNPFRDALVRWFASVSNGIGKLFVGEVESNKIKTKELCLDDVCVTKEQLQYLLQATPTSLPPNSTPELPPEEVLLEDPIEEAPPVIEETASEPPVEEVAPIA